jgi:GAF domain-containing protein
LTKRTKEKRRKREKAVDLKPLQLFPSFVLLANPFYFIFFSTYLCPMADDLTIITGSKAEIYQSLIPQIKALLEGEPDLVANLGNISAALKEQFGWLWVGFYLVKPDSKIIAETELVLGPFQGPVACTRIKKGRGVCGAAWQNAETLIVPDVEKFPGHIACSSLSKSEIVIPLIKNREVIGVLDVDATELDQFDETDKMHLEEIISLISIP